MEKQTLPLVPFGKYKGEPITTLLNDTKYLKWCTQQAWFQKFPIVYNICVNQTINTNNLYSKTPEHNKLQNMFLDNENVEKLLKITFNQRSKNLKISSGDIKFEGMFNWDLIVSNYLWYLCDCVWPETKIICDCECETYKKYVKKYRIPEDGNDLKFNTLYCEIKPCLGDDYPAVLRKMNTQIELTNNYAKKYNEKKTQEYETERAEDSDMRIYWSRNKGLYKHSLKEEYIYPVYVLIIKEFNSTSATKEQLIEIFNQSHIKIVFIDDLFKKLDVNTSIEQTISISSQEQEIIKTEENNILKEKLLETQQKLLEEQEKNKQLEDKIVQLEYTITKKNKNVQKYQKQSKSINEYFKKK